MKIPGVERYVHWMYAVIAVVVVSENAMLVPPIRVPDEQEHLFRAADISYGGFVEHARSGIVGAAVDTGLIEFESALFADSVSGIPGPISYRRVAQIKAIHWQGRTAWRAIPAASRCGPLLYLPAAAMLYVCRHCGFTVLSSFYLARLANGFAAIAIITFAIAASQRAKLLIAAIALLPMATSMMGSISQEGGIIGASLLCAGLVTRGDVATRRDYILLAAAIAALGLARPPFVCFAGLLWLRMWRQQASIPLIWRAATPFVCAFIVAAWLFTTLKLQGPIWTGPTAVMAAQQAFVQQHPLALPMAVVRTIVVDFVSWYEMFIGRLGWLDVPLPTVIHLCATMSLFLGIVIMLTEPSQNCRFDRILIAGTAACVLFMLLLTLYFAWTPTGASTVVGMQGRYLFGIVTLFLVAMPSIRVKSGFAAKTARAVGTYVALLLPIYSITASVRTVQRHYKVVASSVVSTAGIALEPDSARLLAYRSVNEGSFHTQCNIRCSTVL